MSSEYSIAAIVLLVDALESDGIVVLGELPVGISMYWPVVRKASVVLTGERKRHILSGHSEMAELIPALIRTVHDPDEIHRNKRDPMMAICWRTLEKEKSYLRVALLLSGVETLQHSVMSAWRVRRKDYERERRQKRMVWEKVNGA